MEHFREFEVRWSDVDANRHLANSAYINFMSHTRMYYLMKMGFTHRYLEEHNIGPVVFHEHIWYYKEVLPGDTVRVSFEIKGFSEDGMFFEFHHNFYGMDGKHLAHCELMGGWFSLETRKLIPMTDAMLKQLHSLKKAEDFRLLTKEDTRKHARFPKDLA